MGLVIACRTHWLKYIFIEPIYKVWFTIRYAVGDSRTDSPKFFNSPGQKRIIPEGIAYNEQ